MSLMSRGMSMLKSQLQSAAGVSVTYTRGAYSVSLTAVVGRTVFASNLQGAARIEFGDRDYLIEAADLILNSATVEPVKGDRITEVVNGATMVFEAMIPSTGEPCWRYSDPARTILRIHCKRVS